MNLEIITIIFLAISFLQLLFYYVFLGRLVFKKTDTIKASAENPPVSVVISAHNEYYNLEENLPKILNQDYPEFEVVVVNDQSEDDSDMLLRELSNKYSKLNYVEVKNPVTFVKGKKFPLAIGIRSAKYEHLLLTDADCYPASDKWIKSIAAKFNDKTKIVLGHGEYEHDKGFLNTIIRFDNIRNSMLYLSAAIWKIPYMGLGRNLAYNKSLFEENNGFTSHYQIASGDDDLFINQVANSKNTAVCYSPEAITISKTKTNFKKWSRQKQRHLSTSKHYKFGNKLFLGLWELLNYSFYFIFILSLILNTNIIICLSAFSLVFITKIIFFVIFVKKLELQKILLSLLAGEILLLLLYPFIKAKGIFRRDSRWN